MLEFKKYINEEIQKESITDPLKFLGGFATNLVGQGLRGAGNLIKGGAETVAGGISSASNLVSAGVYELLGNKKQASQNVKNFGSGISLIGKGLKGIVKAVIQLGGAASGITPTLRGFQAANEKGISGFNKNRNSTQKLLGLNSNEETPYIIDNLPNSAVDAKEFIDNFYYQTKIGREIKINKKPEKFLKRFVLLGILVSGKYKDPELNDKFKFLINTFFPNFEVIELNVGTFLNKTKDIFYYNSDIVQYINYLYEKSLKDKVIIITNSDSLFFKELELIYKQYLKSDKPEDQEIIDDLKNKVKEAGKKFWPNKIID